MNEDSSSCFPGVIVDKDTWETRGDFSVVIFTPVKWVSCHKHVCLKSAEVVHYLNAFCLISHTTNIIFQLSSLSDTIT